MLKKIAPILPALSLRDTEAFYRSILRFTTHHYGSYLVAMKDGVEIHFYEWSGPVSFMPSTCCLFDDNIQDLYTKFSSLDVIFPNDKLRDNIWGKKEFRVLDNNGNVLKFVDA